MYKAAVFFLLINLFALGCLANPASTTPSAHHTNTLIASTTLVPPYVYKEHGQLMGLAVDILREIEKRTELAPIDIRIQPWKRALRWAEDGTSDFVFMSGVDKARQRWGDYMSTPIIVERYRLYRLKSQAVELTSNYQQANRYRIGTERGCLYGHGILREAIDQRFSSNTISNDTESNLKMLLQGRVDVIAGDAVRVAWALEKMGAGEKVVAVNFVDSEDSIVLEWPTYIVFSKKRDHQRLKSKMEEALKEFYASTAYQNLLKQYSGGAVRL
ncbi:substrate-binding periplasmic protein [Pseudoteredinibacter isoporae]|uniref:Polar amino acid transport system substrate-binding protein n=1 Tax=Pseudoteredinibacter isoporae TaxID=570281 RepID=A0A7X0MUI9_9GAMM|nr:transporter substrate-binding domain-containing protein [Pseudoteredinibacter isoporae]MBB6520681.1 polar amino acid transport system substrate-binding protein [Pseudoteredinibacter isoporae]NHO86248.1 amino acid ABC transporter substrate-binding protein [Pseudoteredinibacter isoporae]NIB25301.1 amino acid ABC transporter substrate-binding protein [Pseudoteredinibacter isoporae]